MSEMIKRDNLPEDPQTENAYISIRGYVIDAQQQVYSAVNTAMVTAYWNIGKTIYEICGENERAAYGKKVLKYISDRLTKEFGKGFDESNLRNMRRFYLTFSIYDTVCPELSWSYYRLLMRVANEKERVFYTQEAAKSGWSVRQLGRNSCWNWDEVFLLSPGRSISI